MNETSPEVEPPMPEVAPPAPEAPPEVPPEQSEPQLDAVEQPDPVESEPVNSALEQTEVVDPNDPYELLDEQPGPEQQAQPMDQAEMEDPYEMPEQADSEPPVMEQPEPVETPKPETSEPPVEYDTVRDALLQNIDHQKLQNHANSLYKPGASAGDGGTAAALFHEKETGELVKGKSHEIKSWGHEAGLYNLVEGGKLNVTDREIAKDLQDDLANALLSERK